MYYLLYACIKIVRTALLFPPLPRLLWLLPHILVLPNSRRRPTCNNPFVPFGLFIIIIIVSGWGLPSASFPGGYYDICCVCKLNHIRRTRMLNPPTQQFDESSVWFRLDGGAPPHRVANIICRFAIHLLARLKLCCGFWFLCIGHFPPQIYNIQFHRLGLGRKMLCGRRARVEPHGGADEDEGYMDCGTLSYASRVRAPRISSSPPLPNWYWWGASGLLFIANEECAFPYTRSMEAG